MRALLVLLLVLAALTVVFFAYRAGPVEPEPPALSGPDATAVQTAADGSASLAADQPVERETAKPEPARQAAAQAGDQNVLTGLVIGNKKQPVEDAEVTLTRAGRTGTLFASENFDRKDDRKTKTNERGRFLFENVEPYEGYSLIVRHPEFAPEEVGNVNIGQAPRYEEPPIRLEKGARVHGRVLDSAGGGVAGALLYMNLELAEDQGELADHPDTMRCESGEDGAYEFPNVAAGRYVVEVDAEEHGHLRTSLAVNPRQDVRHDFQLETGQSLAGRVTSRGAPIEKAKVRVTSNTDGSLAAQSRSDEAGDWEARGLPEGSYTILAVAPGYRPSRRYSAEAGQSDVLIELTPVPAVHGRVVDAESGKPVSKFRVRLRGAADPGDIPAPMGGFGSREHPEGEFILHTQGPGKFMVEAVADGYADTFSDAFALAAEQTLEGVEVRLSRGARLIGRVVDSDGKPVKGATVVTHDDDWRDDPFTRSLGDYNPTLATTRQAYTSSRGEFELSGLRAALYQVDVRHPDYAREVTRGIEVEEGTDNEAGEVVLVRGAVVRGTVYGPDGEPLVGAVVQLSPAEMTDGSSQSYSGKTNAEGKYEVRQIRAGAYLASASRASDLGGTSMAEFEASKASERRLNTVSGETHEGVDFHLAAPRGR